MPDAELIAAIRNKDQALRLVMDEKVRRRWAACEARAIGWGGITAVAATGLSRPTIRAGLAEVQGGASRSAEDHQPEGQRVPPWWRGTATFDGGRPYPSQRFASVVGVFHTWGPAVAFAMDQQKHSSPRRRAWATRASGQSPHRGSVA